ncbi:MAG TPA: hypothetical protein VGB04_09990 [Allosphingosinicella sp.]
MPSSNSDPAATTAQGSGEKGSNGQASRALNPSGQAAAEPGRAALGPIPEPVPVTENPVPDPPADSPAEAEGRRTLSTAFVRVGPDGRLVVELRSGRVLVLRDVVMRPKDYCGVQVLGGKAGGQYCGGYAEVAAARPGASSAPQQPEPAVEPPRPAERN